MYNIVFKGGNIIVYILEIENFLLEWILFNVILI